MILHVLKNNRSPVAELFMCGSSLWSRQLRFDNVSTIQRSTLQRRKLAIEVLKSFVTRLFPSLKLVFF